MSLKNFLSRGGKSKLFNEQTQQLPKETTSPTPAQETPVITTLDCKQDFDCFIQASQNCKLAKVDYTATTDIFGIKQTTESLLEIKGVESNKCTFYLRTEKIDLAFPASMPSEVISQQKEIYKKLEGKVGSCKFITSDLTAMLERWKQGNLSTEDFKATECQGTYFGQSSPQSDSQNASCRLQISFGSMVINGQKTEAIKTSQSMLLGVGSRAYAIGYQGQADQVSWKSSNDTIAKIEPGQDGTVIIKSINPGKAVITVTDNSTNPPCASTINWESTQ